MGVFDSTSNLTVPEQVQAGLWPGAMTWSKFGVGLVTTAWSTVYSAGSDPGLYNWDELDLNPRRVAIASTDPDDTLLGTGAKFIYIEGTGIDHSISSETIELNGQTPVESVYEYNSIYRMENTSDQDLQGQCYTGAFDAVWVGGEPDVVIGHINDGYNQSQMVLYRVPAGFRLMVYRVTITSKNKEGEAGFYIRSNGHKEGVPKTVFANKVPYMLSGGPIPVDVQRLPFTIMHGFDIELRAKSDLSTMLIACNLTGVLMPEHYFPR